MSNQPDPLEVIRQALYDPDRIYTIPDCAAYLGTTEGALRALIKRGALLTVQIGTVHYVSQSAIHKWIEGCHMEQELQLERQSVVRR